MYVVLNYVYLTFLVHFRLKWFFFLYEQDVYFETFIDVDNF